MKHRIRISTSIMLGLITLLLLSEFVTAAPRKDLIARFCTYNSTSAGWYKDTPNSTVTSADADEFITYANVYVINTMGKPKDIDNRSKEWFVGQFKFGDRDDMASLFFAFDGMQICGGTVNKTELNDTANAILLNQEPVSKGFKNLNNVLPSAVGTYFAVALLKSFNKTNLVNADEIYTYIMSLWDDTIGAFKGTNESTANIIDSFSALKAIELVGKMSAFTTANRSKLINFTNSLYCNRSDLESHYGASFTTVNWFSTILLTYYCVQILVTINGTLQSQTLKWILSRQSPADYGFLDVNEQGTNRVSSAKLTYYAVCTIFTIEPKALDNSLNEDYWNLTPNPWYIAAIVVGSVGIVVLLIVAVYKYKNRV